MAPREGLELELMKLGCTGPPLEPRRRPLAGKSGDPISRTPTHAMRLHYLPHAMHAAYVAEDKGVVGRVNWQFLFRVLKSFMGHYWSAPPLLALHDAWGNQ